VFVCDNLAFIGDHVIRRKHMVKAKRELPEQVTAIVQPLQAQRIAQNQKLLVLLSQKVAGTDVENQLFEKIHDWRARG
jgi:hypothetical protein